MSLSQSFINDIAYDVYNLFGVYYTQDDIIMVADAHYGHAINEDDIGLVTESITRHCEFILDYGETIYN